ncbi:MAG: hypothetical protein J6D21_07180 [Clostridia bacterium]|nr:hypothetical protein [Clostridia bacterium]
MKKLIVLLIIISLLMSMAIVAPTAADIEGDWMTYRESNDYREIDPDTGEETAYRPAPGYHYTDEGFSTIPADYTGTWPYFNVQTKDKHNLKDGLYLKFRVDEYSYEGPDKNADAWIALSFMTTVNLSPEQDGTKNGWFGLIRGEGDGDPADFAGHAITPEYNDGREVYILEVDYDGELYHISLNGVPFTDQQNQNVTNNLNSKDQNGDFYIGISMRSTVKDGKASLTIMEYGTCEDDALVPQGSDSKEPEENVNIPADMMDPSLIPANKPGVYFDASLYTNPPSMFYDVMALGNNGFRISPTPGGAGFVTWNMRRDTSYALEDFPVFAMMVQNYWGSGTLWPFIGNTMGPSNNCIVSFNAFDGLLYDGEYEDCALIIADLTDVATGRINGFRIDISSEDEFDILYAGCFRSWEEAEAYSYDYLGISTKADTEEPAETEAPTSDETDASVDTEQTTVENVTEKPSENQTTGAGNDKKSGCASFVGVGMMPVFAAAVSVLLKKKKEQ